jgi:hypothetical protein
MTEHIIAVSPSFDRLGKRRHERFDARLKDSDELICEATRQPLLDAARVMLGRSVDPSTVICMVHAHAPAVVTVRATIGVAAQFDVMGEKFIRRKSIAGPMSGSGIENNHPTGSTLPSHAKAVLGASYNGAMKTANPPLASPTPSSSAASTTGN